MSTRAKYYAGLAAFAAIQCFLLVLVNVAPDGAPKIAGTGYVLSLAPLAYSLIVVACPNCGAPLGPKTNGFRPPGRTCRKCGADLTH